MTKVKSFFIGVVNVRVTSPKPKLFTDRIGP